MNSTGELFVATERLGWPRATTGWRRLIPWQTQHRLTYADGSEQPTATCHLQRTSDEPARCGFASEGLVRVPSDPAWTDLHPGLRCDVCGHAVGIADEDPAGRVYRHGLNRPGEPQS